MTAAQSVMPLPERPGKWFSWDEFACKDAIGTPYPLDWHATRGVRLGRELDRIRARTGPLVLSSVYRTWAHHQAIYAAMHPPQTAPAGSDHLRGDGADVTCPAAMKWPIFVEHVLDAAHEPGCLIRYLRFYRRQRFCHVGIRNTDTLLVEYDTQ
jgi:hypothetical protein